MELAGLKVVMDADFSAVFSGLAQANAMLQNFANNVKSAFNGIPDFKNKFNFTTNGASQAAQDAREYARAAREQAAADLDAAKAADIAARAEDRKNKKDKEAKDLYGQLVAESQALVREYYNAAAAQIKLGEASGVTAAKLEEMRLKAKAGQDQLQLIEQGAGRFQRNVGNYASGFNPLNNSINQLTREFPAFANSVQTGLLGISNNIAPLADAINQITRQQKIAKAETEAAALAKYKQAEAAAIAAGATKAEAKEAGKLAATMAIANPEQLKAAAAARLSAEGSALAAGATALQAKAAGDLAAKQALANVQTAASPGVFKALTAAIFSWQTALSIGVTLLTVYGPKLFAMAKGAGAATEAQKKYTEALNEASKAVQVNALEEVNKLAILSRVAQDNNQKLEERKEAVAQLRRINPQYFKDLSDEQILYGDLSTVIRQATADILANAKAKAFAAKADVAAKKYADEYDALSKVTQKQAEYFGKNQKLIEQQERNAAAAASQASNARSAGITQTAQLSKYLSLEKDRQEALDKTLEAQKDIIKFQNLAAANNVDTKGLFGGGGKEKAAKDVRTVTDAYDELVKKNKIADAELLAGAATVQETLKKKVANYKSYIVELSTTKLNLSIDSPQINEAFGEISKLSNELNKLEPPKLLDDSTFDGKKYIQAGDGFKYMAAQATISFAQVKKAQEDAISLRKIEEFKERMALLLKDVQLLIADTIAQTAVLVAEGIGNIIVGVGGLGDLFKSIGQFLGDQIIAFGKQLIEAGGLMQLAQAAIKSLSITPALAIVAGVAAVALGAALKAALSNSSQKVGKTTAFASGGVVYGPTNALVGEYAGARGNPEVIAPLDKLISIFKQQNIGNRETTAIIPDVRIEGQDLLLIFDRANRAKNR